MRLLVHSELIWGGQIKPEVDYGFDSGRKMRTIKNTAANRHSAKSPLDEDVVVGKNLRRIRRSMEMSQSELGALIGLTFQQVQKYESGTNRVSAGRLAQLARELDVDIIEFFATIDLPSAETTVDVSDGSAADVECIRLKIGENLSLICHPEKLKAILSVSTLFAEESS